MRLLVEQVRFGSERGLSRPCSGLLWSCDVTDVGPWVGPLVAYGDCRSDARGVPLPPALADGLDVRGQPGQRRTPGAWAAGLRTTRGW